MRILSVGIVRASDDSCNNAPGQEAGRHPPTQPLHEVLPPGIDRLGAKPVLLRHLRLRPLIGRAEDYHHLPFAESRLLHGSFLGREGAR